MLELRRASERARLTTRSASSTPACRCGSPSGSGTTAATARSSVSTDPAAPDRVVATAAIGTAAEAEPRSRPRGRRSTPGRAPPRRSARTPSLRAAGHLRTRAPSSPRSPCASARKPWAEADADICEAIDFLEYYARGAIELDRGAGARAGPRRAQRAALRAARRHRGHLALELPARHPARDDRRRPGDRQHGGPQARRAGAGLRARARRGAPRGRRAGRRRRPCCPARARRAPRSREHRDVATIAFTGSGAVGLELMRTAASAPDGARQLKRVVAEMGGKNCVIVDADADLDDAVPGDRAERLRLRRPEVLGRVAGPRARGDRRRAAGAPRRRGRRPARSARRTRAAPTSRRSSSARRRSASSATRGPRAAQGDARRARRASPAAPGWYVPAARRRRPPADSAVLRDESSARC